MFQGLTEDRFNLILSIVVRKDEWDLTALFSAMQGSAVTWRELRAAAEWIRLGDVASGENNEGLRGQLLDVARLYQSTTL